MDQFENNTSSIIEMRSGIDRRKKHPPIFSKYCFLGNRRLPRREEDRQISQKVDRYSSKLLPIIILILVLSILDAFFTLILVENGAKELNPFMDYYLAIGPFCFFWVKYLLTGASIVLILFVKDSYVGQTRIKAGALFLFLPIPFVVVINWQLVLMFFYS